MPDSTKIHPASRAPSADSCCAPVVSGRGRPVLLMNSAGAMVPHGAAPLVVALLLPRIEKKRKRLASGLGKRVRLQWGACCPSNSHAGVMRKLPANCSHSSVSKHGDLSDSITPIPEVRGGVAICGSSPPRDEREGSLGRRGCHLYRAEFQEVLRAVHDMPATSSRHQLQGQAQSSNSPVCVFSNLPVDTYSRISPKTSAALKAPPIDTLTSACAQKSG